MKYIVKMLGEKSQSKEKDLITPCSKDSQRFGRGESHKLSKLKNEDVIYIFTQKDKTNSELGRIYNVSEGSIRNIKSGRTWSWLTEGLDAN